MIKVFVTGVRFKKTVKVLRPQLNHLLSGANWNFDLEDRDKILRIESKDLNPELVIKLLIQNGIYCHELTD